MNIQNQRPALPPFYLEPGKSYSVPASTARELADNGRTMMDHFVAVDNTEADLNPEEGKVELRKANRFGQATISVAEFSGDRFEGTLAINRDNRQASLDREFRFGHDSLNWDTTTVTDRNPSYYRSDKTVYEIRGGEGTAQRFVEE